LATHAHDWGQLLLFDESSLRNRFVAADGTSESLQPQDGVRNLELLHGKTDPKLQSLPSIDWSLVSVPMILDEI
jgi:hypothetical protein